VSFASTREGLSATVSRPNLPCHPFRLSYINSAYDDKKGWKLSIYFTAYKPQTAVEKQFFLHRIRPEQIAFLRSSGSGPAPLSIESIEAPSEDSNDACLTLWLKQAEPKPKSPLLHAAQYSLEFHHVIALDPLFARATFYLGFISQSDPRLCSQHPKQSYDPGILPVEINYMAKDYDSFRQTMLDHLTLFLPHWKERHPADLGIVLVEVLAYVADYLSYYQDTVATEAYLETARQRNSIRRHVRLLDYRLSEGCNTRVWVHLSVNDRKVSLPKGTIFLTGMSEQPVQISTDNYLNVLSKHPKVMVFESIYGTVLNEDHNLITLNTSDIKDFRLLQGSTEANLAGTFPLLSQGDVLLFERFHDNTGDVDTAGLPAAHPIRLNSAPLLTVDPVTHEPITKISWYQEDALPYDLPITGCSHNGVRALNRYILRGNIVLADAGRSIAKENLPEVVENKDYQPALKYSPLIYGVPFEQDQARNQSAANAMVQQSENALPAVRVEEILSPWSLQNSSSKAVWLNTPTTINQESLQSWQSQSDLLNSGPFSQDFVVESQEDGSSTLRFGNGELGKKPGIHSRFQASYRVRVGDVNDVIGPETLQHIVTDDKRIRGIRNPMDSFSFEAQETLQHARLNAPQLFKSQKRCITVADHIEEAEKFPDVKVATVQQSWTGSWETVFLYVQRYGGRPINALFSKNLLEFLNPMRLAGRDIQIKAPQYVPLDIALEIQLMPQAPKMQIRNQLEVVLSNLRADSFFFPDHFTFGQTVYQSQIVAVCANIPGVAQVSVTRFCRYGRMHHSAAVVSEITIGPLEIICLSNDPARPELGKLSLNISGGISL